MPAPHDPVPQLLNSAHTLFTQGKTDQALDLLRQATLTHPRSPDLLFHLGNALYASRRYRDAADAFKRLTALLPDSPEAWGNYSSALLELNEVDQSLAAARKVAALRPREPLAFYNLGNSLRRAGLRDQAEDAYRQCVALNPNLGPAWGNLAICVAELGRIEEAMPLYRTAMSLTPESWVAESYIYMLNYHPGESRASIVQAHRQWNNKYVKPLATRPQFHNTRDPDRRLRVGYVSAYFYGHVLSFYQLPLLQNHDRSAVEIYCYNNSAHQDDITRQLRQHSDVWRDVTQLDDPALATLIRSDHIDILIDCTMHMQNNRLSAFALRAAPVQACWCAYPGTTGLAEMDYRFSDSHLDPPDREPMGTEKTIRLPDSWWCYDPVTPAPPVSPLPALSSGHITFGCLNNPLKLNDLTLNVWSTILRAVPDSRLLLLTEPGKSPDRIRPRLNALGVSPDRVDFVHRLPRSEYLALYHRIDVALDTFPYNGHTTTLDALYMGVPTLTAPLETTVSRGGLSLLSTIALTDFIAPDLHSLPAKALAVTSDLPHLSTLRFSLRDRMQDSPLMNAPRYARAMEAAYRHMWRAWCTR
jgi:protein O-GlcNAc transferase